MFQVYPSSRLEDLSLVFQAVLSQNRGAVLAPDLIMVESQGMQHWLHMQIAEYQQIAMNLQFVTPMGFIWSTARAVLGKDLVPDDDGYTREVLKFRIDVILMSDEFCQQVFAQDITGYWQSELTDSAQQAKRFQLATSLADSYEQYILYRPNWMQAWLDHQTETDVTHIEPWQAWIWRKLVADDNNHPIRLQQLLIEQLKESPYGLPKQLFIFGINTLPPQTLSFFAQLAEQMDIHLFHLNPCVEFWGDIKGEKVVAKDKAQQLIRSTQGVEGAYLWAQTDDIANPLLANLAGQGKSFFNSLLNTDGVQMADFFDLSHVLDQSESPDEIELTVLKRVQQDIAHLQDARQLPEFVVDDSITISSAHNELREIQALHDFLLHQFAHDPSLSPQDILVMCPAIEEYAPYIDAVFRRPWQQSTDDNPRLSCSIADRHFIDSEPLISTFLDLLQLPDGRFEVSKILEFLALPALQTKFGFTESELSTIEWWLKEACVHWGLNKEHKQAVTTNTVNTDVYTWEWGLRRLILGFLYQDQTVVVNDTAYLPHVEGQNSVLLGRLCQLLQTLQQHSQLLIQARTPLAWQVYLKQLCDDLFEQHQDEQDAYLLLLHVVDKFAEYTQLADYEQPLALATVRYYLNHHFSQPDPLNHFMTGQVTFCSMVPMRSIPFKVVAILGLNDGVFPRQQIPNSFDLMAHTASMAGDRSRRADDRYLFLEALISARQKLYLSYQGQDIKLNSERQPSLILQELMNYLQLGYLWPLTPSANAEYGHIWQLPLHAASAKAYQGQYPSFAAPWLNLFNEQSQLNNQLVLATDNLFSDDVDVIDLQTLIRFFQDPLKVFNSTSLNLHFSEHDTPLEDSEPFDINALQEYQSRLDLVTAYVNGDTADMVSQSWRLSGRLPETPVTDTVLDNSEQQAILIANTLTGFGELTRHHFSTEIKLSGNGELPLQGSVLLTAEQQAFAWRPAARRAKDDIAIWLQHLFAQLACDRPTETLAVYFNFKNKKVVSQIRFAPIEDINWVTENLNNLIYLFAQGLSQPSLLHADLGKALVTEVKKAGLANTFDDEKEVSFSEQDAEYINNKLTKVYQTLANDANFNWLFDTERVLSAAEMTTLYRVYQPLYTNLQEVKR